MTNLVFTFDTSGKSPLYRQLYDFIKSEIRSGRLPAAQKLPAKRQLAVHLGISLNTVENAYEQLSAEGYIRSVPRSGSYVCKIEEIVQIPAPADQHSASTQRLADVGTQECLYDLSTNQVDTSFFPYKTWTRTIREIMQDKTQNLLRMTHPQGDYQLRQSLAEYLHAFRGVNCQPDQIVIGAGMEYLLSLIIQILGRSRKFAVENPGYRKTVQVLQSNGVAVLPVGLDSDGIDISQLEKTSSDVVYVTPSHHFPLGIIMPVSRRLQLLRWASQSEQRYILEDDYDSEFRFVGRPIPALQGMDQHGRVIYLGTFSKSLAPSIRISFMVLPPKLLARYQKDFSFYSSTVSRFEQEVLHRFIQNGHFEKHLNRMRIVYRERKDALTGVINRSPWKGQLQIIGENAGLHLLLRVQNELSEKDLIKRAQSCGIKLSGLSEYAIAGERIEDQGSEKPYGTVMIGYSHYAPQKIAEIMQILLDVWFS